MAVVNLPRQELLERAEPLEENLARASALFGPPPFLASAFSSLLLWRDFYDYALVSLPADAGHAVLSFRPGEVFASLPPVPFRKESLEALFQYLAAVQGPGAGFSRVEGLTAAQAAAAQTWGFPARPLADEFIYDRARLADLHGDPFRDRRNEINRLTRERSPDFRPFRADDLDACVELYDRWKESRKARLDPLGIRMLEQSRQAHLRALRRLEALDLGAWVARVDGRLAAYTVAGTLAADTLGVFLETADLTVPGLAAYIFVHLCRLHGDKPWVNTGDAQFLPGLEAAKELWHPARRATRYAVDPKPG